MNILRRNSPSLTTSSPTSRWRRTASRIASSSSRRSSDRSRSVPRPGSPSALVRRRRRPRNAGRPGAGATRRPRPEPASVERESRRKDRWPRTAGPGYRRPVSTILETERLRLRHYHRDLSDLSAPPRHPVRSAPHAVLPAPIQRGGEPRVDRSRLQQYDQLGCSLWAAEDRATCEFLGNVGPTPQEVDGVEEIELGWSVTPTRSGQGIATEAGLACREWCFAHLDVDHLISLVSPRTWPPGAWRRRSACTSGRRRITPGYSTASTGSTETRSPRQTAGERSAYAGSHRT
jgi:ribosomal-protein-alanine N-acetyltransferase